MQKSKAVYSIRPLFPKRWSQKKILGYALEIATDPSCLREQITQKGDSSCRAKKRPVKFAAEGTRGGISIRVIFEEEEGPQIITAYPLCGPE